MINSLIAILIIQLCPGYFPRCSLFGLLIFTTEQVNPLSLDSKLQNYIPF